MNLYTYFFYGVVFETYTYYKSVYFCSTDKEKQKEIRERAILKVQEKEAKKCKAKASRIQQEKKYALETMMKVEIQFCSQIY